MIDKTDELAEKEREITLAEDALDVVEAACLDIENRIAAIKIKRDELGLEIKIEEQKLNALKPDLRKARIVIARKRREHSQIFRGYIKERDAMKGMR